MGTGCRLVKRGEDGPLKKRCENGAALGDETCDGRLICARCERRQLDRRVNGQRVRVKVARAAGIALAGLFSRISDHARRAAVKRLHMRSVFEDEATSHGA